MRSNLFVVVMAVVVVEVVIVEVVVLPSPLILKFREKN
jgi:hypothetical protein